MAKRRNQYKTTRDIAEEFDLSLTTVRHRFQTGQWPATRVGGVWRVSPEQYQGIKDLLHTTGPTTTPAARIDRRALLDRLYGAAS